MGRPTKYTKKIAAAICERIADGESLRRICCDPAMPSRGAVRVWLIKYEDFQTQYVRAHENQADVHAEEIVDIVDEPLKKTYPDGKPVAKADMLAFMRIQLEEKKLRLDARKWTASKLRPKKYGEIKSVEAEDTDIIIHGGLPEPTKEQ